MRSSWTLGLLWLAFVWRGLFFATTTPIWEGFDEHAHFSLADALARGDPWPKASDALPLEIQSSLALLPLPKLLAGTEALSNGQYWKKPPSDRLGLERRFASLGAGEERGLPPSKHLMYEAQQAPAYYWVLAGAERLILDWPLAERVLALRLLTLLVASLLVPFTYMAARRICAPPVALCSVLLLIAMPQLSMSAARIANDIFAAAAVGWVLLQVAGGAGRKQSPWWALLLGLSTGLALLSKGYLLILLPALAVYFFAEWLANPHSRGVIARNGAIAVAVSAASGGWWYVRNLLAGGSLSGEQMEVAARHGQAFRWEELAKMDWVRAVDFILMSHIWLGNWSFLVLRGWMYHAVELGFLAAAVGVALWYWRALRRRECSAVLLMILFLQISMAAAVMYHATVSRQMTNFSGTFGHYLDGTVVTEVILLALGCGVLHRVWGARILVWALVGLDLFGTHVYLLPFYAGRIGEEASGRLPAFQVLHCDWGCVAEIAANLAVNKGPLAAHPHVLILIWGLYLISTIGVGFSASQKPRT